MPFDGAMRRGFLGIDDMLLDMVEFSFEGGSKWTQGAVRKRGGRHCLIGAVEFVRKEAGLEGDHAPRYLTQAIRSWIQRRGYPTPEFLDSQNAIVRFNDAKARQFADIVEVVREARELAQVDEYVRRLETGNV